MIGQIEYGRWLCELAFYGQGRRSTLLAALVGKSLRMMKSGCERFIWRTEKEDAHGSSAWRERY